MRRATKGRPAPGRQPDLTWVPHGLRDKVPPYLALVEALQDDIRDGLLRPGAQLPPHRALAGHLKLSLSTVTKAYREASAQGLVIGHVGQGTFVASPVTSAPSGEVIELGTNLSPDVGQKEALREALMAVVQESGAGALFTYDWRYGLDRQREELASWVSSDSFRPGAEQIVATNGAQQGLELALMLLSSPKDTILVEELTYVGFKALANLHDLTLGAVPMDGEGMIPGGLDAALRTSGARVVYVMPTFQSPTARTMSASRRRDIAAVVARHDAVLIEDDVYGFLGGGDTMPIAGLIPERTIYLASFSKIFDLGFRAGLMVLPTRLVEKGRMALRATAWSATPLLFEAALRLTRSGRMNSILTDLRTESRRRVTLLQALLPGRLATVREHEGYHVWLDLPGDWTPSSLFVAARNQGVMITPPGSAAAAGVAERGVRLCLGAPTPQDLERALRILGRLLAQPIAAIFSVA